MNKQILETASTLAVLVALGSPSLVGEDRLVDDRIDVDAPKHNRQILHVCELDGTPLRPLIQDIELRHRYDRQGTPDASADGSKIAYDAWQAELGFAWKESRIIVANADGSDAKEISDGAMPSFSPDGDRLAVSRTSKYAARAGAKGQSI